MKIKRSTFWMILGGLAGAVAGFLLGGIGIAARGHATGISAGWMVVLVAAAGMWVGYRRSKKSAG